MYCFFIGTFNTFKSQVSSPCPSTDLIWLCVNSWWYLHWQLVMVCTLWSCLPESEKLGSNLIVPKIEGNIIWHCVWIPFRFGSKSHRFCLSWPHCTDGHVCVCLLVLWHTIPCYINSCLSRDLHYWFCVACIQGPLPGNVGFLLWSVSPHICRCGSIGQLLQLMALMLSGWKPIHHTETMVREWKEGGEGASQEVVKKTMAALYFIVLKGYSSQWSHCQAPCLYIHGGNQTHAKLIYGHGRGEMAHHEVTQTDCRQSETHGCVALSADK